jgi:alpha-L-fucosidase
VCSSDLNLRPVIKVTFDGAPTYIPTQTVTAVDGATISSEQFFGRASAMRYSGAQVYDAYLVNKGDKAITDLTLKFSGNFDASTTYKITLGTTSIEVTGAQIEAGEVGEGLTLEPGQVTPLRLELAHPAYYADPIRLGSVSATVHVYGENAATQPPVIATDPASVSVKAGESATFTVVASGRPTATIQWYRVPKGATEGTAIPDATSAMYTLTTTLEDDGAQFYAVATNANGSTTSARATLTVTKGSDNLALNKTATMSSTGWGGTASRAVDGNTDGVWDNGSVAHTGKQANPWWEVDLGEEHPLGVVNVWNRSSSDNCQGISCDQRLHDFWVVASTTRLDASFNPATAGAVDGVHAIKVDGVGGRPSAVDFEGFDARFIRVIQPTEFGEFALAEVEAFAAAAPTPDPDEQEPPVIKPLTVTANPAEDAQISGDGAFRTVTGKEGTQVTIKAEATGTPTPTLFWQIKREGSDSWSIVEDENGPELTLTIDGESNGSVVRVMAMNEAGITESGLVTLALAEEPAPTPDPTPDPAPTPDPTPDPAPTPDHTVGTWMNDGIGWWWKITGGDYAKNETLTLDGRVYRFDQNGYMLTGWVYWDGAWRYHNGAGAQVTGWVNLGGSWFYLTPETGAMVTSWQMVGDKWFFFASNGVMKTGWLYTSGAWYYLDPSGSMHTGWLQMGSNWYFMGDSGAMTIGWKPIGGTWYYFDASGRMVTGWQQIGGVWYYFGTGGDMYTGGHWIGWRWYTFSSGGQWLG